MTALASTATAGHRPQATKHHHAKPTIVLVHGAWADGSGWNDVIKRLQRAGYPVRVPPNPLRSLPGDSATLKSFIATVPGPLILVGHSYGGAVITNAATGDPDVKALVYVDAFAPEKGETIFALTGADSALAGDPTTLFDFVPYPGGPDGDVDLYLKENVFLTSFANGVPTRKAKELYATQRPFALSVGSQESGEPAWRTIPSWYLLGTRDRIITPEAQRFMAERAGSTIVRVRAGHLSLISHPDAVAKLIVRADRGTR
ncbi:alpha/beta fold hydrolase [Aeromicrobium yanjiei]|uniref:Alpha/beta fold hydrolase n=2 Tax=Aeromicrobium yanjiei TaxID=2662028 RepID=A0A5Q2MMT3_9ACTN|nr:alpha/beta fold hydrolase [Aeromicrobium yanjiei]